MKNKVLDNEKRKKIYNYVQKNPGLHLRELSRQLGIHKNNLEYHLNYLIKNDMIVKKKESKYSRYFVSNEIGCKKENLLLFVRLQTAQDIILAMLYCRYTTLSELSILLNKTPTTIKFYLDKLLEHEIIEPAPIENGVVCEMFNTTVIVRPKVGREVIFMLKNPELVYETILFYEKSLIDNQKVKLLVDTINDNNSDVIIEKEITMDELVEGDIGSFQEIFPNPYPV